MTDPQSRICAASVAAEALSVGLLHVGLRENELSWIKCREQVVQGAALFEHMKNGRWGKLLLQKFSTSFFFIADA